MYFFIATNLYVEGLLSSGWANGSDDTRARLVAYDLCRLIRANSATAGIYLQYSGLDVSIKAQALSNA